MTMLEMDFDLISEACSCSCFTFKSDIGVPSTRTVSYSSHKNEFGGKTLTAIEMPVILVNNRRRSYV